ncbi:MAG: DUF4249 domain-containing protein [Bacteroidales bacterium]
MMKFFLRGILVTFLISGCQEVYFPGVDDVEPVLVIEGLLTSEPVKHSVKISYTRSFNERPYFPFVEDAYVEIEDENGDIIPFYYVGSGVYRCDTNNSYQAGIGNTYVLRVTTAEGDIFESTPQTVVESPEITKLVCQSDKDLILVENSYGDVLEVVQEGISVFSETSGILPVKNYYLYRWIGYEQHVNILATLPPGPVNYSYIYRHRRLSGKYLNLIRTGNADDFANYRIRNNQMLFIASEDMISYVQPFPDTTYYFYDEYFEGLLFKLQQLSISDNAYAFWYDAELQLEAEGHLFDPVAAQLKGNIRCVNDSTKPVIGIFNASHVTDKYAYFYIDYKNIIYNWDLEGFPTLYLDTCHWGMPDDWIRKPM